MSAWLGFSFLSAEEEWCHPFLLREHTKLTEIHAQSRAPPHPPTPREPQAAGVGGGPAACLRRLVGRQETVQILSPTQKAEGPDHHLQAGLEAWSCTELFRVALCHELRPCFVCYRNSSPLKRISARNSETPFLELSSGGLLSTTAFAVVPVWIYLGSSY